MNSRRSFGLMPIQRRCCQPMRGRLYFLLAHTEETHGPHIYLPKLVARQIVVKQKEDQVS